MVAPQVPPGSFAQAVLSRLPDVVGGIADRLRDQQGQGPLSPHGVAEAIFGGFAQGLEDVDVRFGDEDHPTTANVGRLAEQVGARIGGHIESMSWRDVLGAGLRQGLAVAGAAGGLAQRGVAAIRGLGQALSIPGVAHQPFMMPGVLPFSPMGAMGGGWAQLHPYPWGASMLPWSPQSIWFGTNTGPWANSHHFTDPRAFAAGGTGYSGPVPTWFANSGPFAPPEGSGGPGGPAAGTPPTNPSGAWPASPHGAAAGMASPYAAGAGMSAPGDGSADTTDPNVGAAAEAFQQADMTDMARIFAALAENGAGAGAVEAVARQAFETGAMQEDAYEKLLRDLDRGLPVTDYHWPMVAQAAQQLGVTVKLRRDDDGAQFLHFPEGSAPDEMIAHFRQLLEDEPAFASEERVTKKWAAFDVAAAVEGEEDRSTVKAELDKLLFFASMPELAQDALAGLRSSGGRIVQTEEGPKLYFPTKEWGQAWAAGVLKSRAETPEVDETGAEPPSEDDAGA